MKLICFLKSIWYSITSMMIVSGHDYMDVTDKYSKVYRKEGIEILECQLCHHISIGFKGDTDNVQILQ